MTIADVGGSTTTATSTATVADAPLTANGSPVSATEGSSTGTVTVATFTDANPSATAGDFTATINWGDGTSSSGTITEDPNTKIFSVNGAAHTYTEEGHYTITATIADVGGSTTTATSTATVADARADRERFAGQCHRGEFDRHGDGCDVHGRQPERHCR